MGIRSSLSRTLGFSVVYLVATYAGRLTVMDETNLSLVWPAAGVSAIWFAVQYRSRWRAADVLALSAVTVVVNVLTGASLLLASCFVLANVVQASLFAFLLHRWLSQLWAAGGDDRLTGTRELWRLMAATLLGIGGGALLGPTGLWVVTGTYSWTATAVWMTRNTVSILLFSAVWLTWGHSWRNGTAAGLRTWRAGWRSTSVPRRAEYVSVVVASAAAYYAVFGINHGLPLAFPLIAMTIWAGSRLHTGFVVVHDLVFGCAAVLFTLHGTGVFANVQSPAARALVAQAFVGLIAVAGLTLALGRDERTALIRQLRGEQQASGKQAELMTAIVDSMSDGLTVVDEEGRVLLRNPAVRRLVGGHAGTSQRLAEPDVYGLFHPDGSPIAGEEMPYRRALAGMEVHRMDILVRHPGIPEGRLLSVSSSLLPDGVDGTRCAVTVFHDVTAERRHRNELAAFAGVVAHDLLNPLATVRNWTESLTEDLEADPTALDVARTRDGLTRIGRAARRMNSMIDDLLEYTTARDATLAPTLVDLGDVVHDVAIARMDQVESTGKRVPAFDIDDLHTVYADPVLVRQLLENLISNAIKYTAPDVAAHIRIRSRLTDHLVTVTIDDNGVGIPDGQHTSIFDDFHRAHRAAGYSGTGLGLGICQRIVERHGGTITAAARTDSHGSRFTFTLPADAVSPATDHGPAESPDHTPLNPVPPATVQGPPPGDELPERRSLPTAASFQHAAQLVLAYLQEQIPLAFWSVTRVENGRQTYLYLDAGNGYGLRQGDSHPWADSYCIHMAAGHSPPVAPDARAVPEYAGAAVNQILDIGAYAGAVITEPDGSLFGGICGLDPHPRTGDPRLKDAEPLLAVLGRLLTAALAADRDQDQATNALLREQLRADTDALTDLPNRRAWQRIIERTRTRFERLGDPTVIAMLDLDRLKIVNDTRGHAAGDAYIQAAAAAAHRAIRDTDFIARLGGDEFGIILTHCTRADAETVIARINTELEAAGVAGSIGWVSVNAEEGVLAALDQADAAMYGIKQQRRREQEAAPLSHAAPG